MPTVSSQGSCPSPGAKGRYVARLERQTQEMTATELADFERGFKVLKSELEIAPVFHGLPERIKAHASSCFIALIRYRVMLQRLKLAGAGSELSPT